MEKYHLTAQFKAARAIQENSFMNRHEAENIMPVLAQKLGMTEATDTVNNFDTFKPSGPGGMG